MMLNDTPLGNIGFPDYRGFGNPPGACGENFLHLP